MNSGAPAPSPFVVFALPRSRTAWLARSLTYGPWTCAHDEIRHCRAPEDITAWLSQAYVGSVETAGAPFWRYLRMVRPDARIAVVRRPVSEVLASLLAIRGIEWNAERLATVLRAHDRKLDQIERRVPGVVSVSFSDLADEATYARLFEHCLGLSHDPAWWADLAGRNVQINLPAYMRYFQAYEPQLDKLAKRVAHRITLGMQPKCVAGPDDGMMFQVETFRQFYADAKALIAMHCEQSGHRPDEHTRFNLPMFRALDSFGVLQVMTARANGRMFGYLLTIIAPGLDRPDLMQGTHTAFFTSPDVRGLGMRLQRAALEALRQRGVHEVIMRAGVLGNGPRMGTYYRRLGAEDFGQMYKLELQET